MSKPSPSTHILTIRVPVTLASDLARLANLQGTTISEITRRALLEYLAQTPKT